MKSAIQCLQNEFTVWMRKTCFMQNTETSTINSVLQKRVRPLFRKGKGCFQSHITWANVFHHRLDSHPSSTKVSAEEKVLISRSSQHNLQWARHGSTQEKSVSCHQSMLPSQSPKAVQAGEFWLVNEDEWNRVVFFWFNQTQWKNSNTGTMQSWIPKNISMHCEIQCPSTVFQPNAPLIFLHNDGQLLCRTIEYSLQWSTATSELRLVRCEGGVRFSSFFLQRNQWYMFDLPWTTISLESAYSSIIFDNCLSISRQMIPIKL